MKRWDDCYHGRRNAQSKAGKGTVITGQYLRLCQSYASIFKTRITFAVGGMRHKLSMTDTQINQGKTKRTQ